MMKNNDQHDGGGSCCMCDLCQEVRKMTGVVSVNINHPSFRSGFCGAPHPEYTVICTLKPDHFGDTHYNVATILRWLNVAYPSEVKERQPYPNPRWEKEVGG